MKRLLSLAFLVLVGFYLVWPAWSGYQIYTAINARDAGTLERKIDWPSVRASLRPAVTQKVSQQFDALQGQAGPTGALIAGQLKGDALPKIVDTVLAELVTPANLVRVVQDGLPLQQSVNKLLAEEFGRLPGMAGGLGALTSRAPGDAGGVPGLGQLGDLASKMGIDPGKLMPGLGGGAAKSEPVTDAKPAPAPGAGAGGSSFGIGNLKSFSMLGPLGFALGVAKDAASKDPDVVAEMRFIAGDWKLTGVTPRL